MKKQGPRSNSPKVAWQKLVYFGFSPGPLALSTLLVFAGDCFLSLPLYYRNKHDLVLEFLPSVSSVSLAASRPSCRVTFRDQMQRKMTFPLRDLRNHTWTMVLFVWAIWEITKSQVDIKTSWRRIFVNWGAGIIEASIKALLKIISMTLGKKDHGRKRYF